MRTLVGTGVVVGVAGLALAGCSRAGEGNAAAPAATSTFSPPVSTSRLDYGSRMERRFRKLYKNQDDKLESSEFPKNRGERMIKRLDTDGDGAVSADEWSKGMLARFDKRDKNRDGTLTDDEGNKGERGGKRGRRQGGIDDETDEVDNGF